MLDKTDQELLTLKISLWENKRYIKSGDFVRFKDGTLRRVSHVWQGDHGRPDFIQTSDRGSFYFGNGYMSFSGGLRPGLDASLFSLTNETIEGWAWFFSHDIRKANNAVNVKVPCQVWAAACLPN